MISLFMLPVDIIFAIFGNDPDKPMFYVGLMFILAYCLLIGLIGTAMFVFIILSGLHMLGSIASWF